MEMDTVLAHVGVAGGDLVSRGEAEACLVAVRRLRSWLDFRQTVAVRELARIAASDTSMFAEKVVADACRGGLRAASRLADRAVTGSEFPAMETALADGLVQAGHVDAITAAARGLSVGQRTEFVRLDSQFAAVAARCTPEEFGRRVRAETRRIVADDGVGRLEAQRQATRLRCWTDNDSGMVCLRGEFDPETGMRIIGRIATTTDSLFHDTIPDTAPADPGARQDHLRALAFVAIIDRTSNQPSTSAPRPEVNIVIDAQTLTDRRRRPDSVFSATGGVDIPVSSVERIMCNATIITTITNHHGVALAVLDRQRTRRLATQSQRRALRTMYNTCAIPDCTVPFDHCEPHHITPWEHNGTTNLNNLLPLCTQHHHKVHDHHWHLQLDHQRNLTITHPNNTQQHTPMKIPKTG